MRFAMIIVAGVLVGATAAHAKGTGEARFPSTVSDQMLQDLVRVGSVEATFPRDADAWLRWGGAPLEHQVSAMRAVVDALSVERPPIGLAAAILAIARVESGWNPYSRNPTSTACGLFQFVKATWATYDDSQQRCFDSRANATAGVKHLTTLYRDRVAPRIELITAVTSETERLRWTYRMLFALHYHGAAAPAASEGGSLLSRTAADPATSQLEGFFTILKKTTAAPAVTRDRGPTRAARRTLPARAKRRQPMKLARSSDRP
jgi:hypothetical protein